MSWFDNAAKAAARRSAGAGDLEPGSELTRRDALKKAGIVGGAALWMTPVVQTVLAPPASATVVGQPTCTGACGQGCASLCGAGGTCDNNLDCLSNSCDLVAGTCNQGAVGANCGTSNANCTTGRCFSGTCAGKPRGATCSANTECYSGSCNGNACGAVNNGGTCLETIDCGQGKVCNNGICANQ